MGRPTERDEGWYARGGKTAVEEAEHGARAVGLLLLAIIAVAGYAIGRVIFG